MKTSSSLQAALYRDSSKRAAEYATKKLDSQRLQREFEAAIAAEQRAGREAPRWAVWLLTGFIIAGLIWAVCALTIF